MKLCFIQYTRPALLIIAIPVFFTLALLVLAVKVLIEKIISHRKTPPPPYYYRLTSWEEEPEYSEANQYPM